ncbi:MAG: aldehyde dehydrogenase family protein [Candidatus Dormiibacterota bacterium]
MGKLVVSGSGLLINGEWVRPGPVVPVIDKYLNVPVTELRTASKNEVEAAVGAAVAASRRELLPAWRRAEILEATARIMEDRSPLVIAAYVAETGFTLNDARTELKRAVETLRLCAGEAMRLTGETVPVEATRGSERRLAFTLRVPVGVVCAIAPFNAPLSTVVHKVGPAIAAGNSVVLKPATLTPLCSVLLAEALIDAGLPPGLFQLVVGSGDEVGAALTGDTRIRYFTFTGSTTVGLAIKRRSHIAKTHLELGSNSATIVCHDADIERAADLITRAGYRKAGQVCTSVQRVLVDRKVQRRLEESLASRVDRLITGDPSDPETNVGPMISIAAATRAEEWLTEAQKRGARALVGGARQGAMLKPSLLADVPLDTSIMNDEIFAPVVAIHPVDSLDEAIEIANQSQYGLQAGVFTESLNTALRLARALEVGGVMVNDTSSYHADLMPYGGVKASGYGLEGPRYAIQDMTDQRIIVFNPATPKVSSA